MNRQKTSAATAAIIILASLLVPFYTFEFASATTFDFYGGTLPGSYGAIPVDGYLDLHWVIAGSPVFFYVGLLDGATLVATFSGTATYTGTVDVVVGFSLVSGDQTLQPGHTYTFDYNGAFGDPGVYASIGNAYLVCNYAYTVSFSAPALNSTATGTVLTVDGVPINYATLAAGYSKTVADGDPVTFVWASSITSTIPRTYFNLGSANASSPLTVTGPTTVTATYSTSTTPLTYNVTLHGPYFEDGTVASGYTANFTLMYTNGTVYQNYLTSTGTAGTQYIYSTTSTFTQLSWNASSESATYNATRVYRFANGEHGLSDTDIYLYILNPLKPAYIYTFSITDFYGMINPYLQTSVSNGTTSHVVERVNLKDMGGGYVSFVMQQYGLYTLSFVCQQGTYSQSFTPSLVGTPGQNVVTLTVLAGNFPASNTVGTITVYANRTATQTIQISYIDPNATTTYVQAAISHLQGTTTINDYTSANASGATHTFTWTNADGSTNYRVTLTALISGETQTFTLFVPAASGSNPWDIDWSYFGRYIPTLPVSYTGWGGIDPSQIVAGIIILFALAVGSYFSTTASMFISWAMAAIMLILGWWQSSALTLVFALLVTILTAIDEYKKGAFNI